MIHLVIGGARSGKSNFAEQLVLANSANPVYIATATADDEEMKKRILHHQQSRSSDWLLVEEKYNLSEVIKNHSDDKNTLLIECMTLWLSNWLCSDKREHWSVEKQHFLDNLVSCQTDIVIVSNEVGTGIVPMDELSREFVDQSGWLNQELTGIADQVTLLIAGLPLILKSNSSSVSRI